MQIVNATDVRRDWGGFIDSIIREKPMMIKRSRDKIVAISLAMLKEILAFDKMHVTIMPEEDGSVSAVIEELDLLANAPDENQVIQILAQDAMDYAEEYYKDFEYWHSAPNRKKHLPYVLAILASDTQSVAKELFVCRVGKN